jgi:hypothetical protein
MAMTLALMFARPAWGQMSYNPGQNEGPANFNATNSTGPVTSVYVPPQARQTEAARQQGVNTVLNLEAKANNLRAQAQTSQTGLAATAAVTGAAIVPAVGLATTQTGSAAAWPVLLAWMIIAIGAVFMVLILGAWARRNRPPSHRPTPPPTRHIGLPI